MNETVIDLSNKIKKLTAIGFALSAEDDKDKLLEMILVGAKELTNANAGTLYLLNREEQSLAMEILLNDDLNLAYGGTAAEKVPFLPIPLYVGGKGNHKNVVTHSVLAAKTINIADAYSEQGFDFSGTKAMDSKTGFRSQSFLTIPLQNHKHQIIGAIQLINCQVKGSKEVIAFDAANQELAESLAAQAAITLTNKELLEEQKKLFENFIELIAKTIDSTSAYTGEHCSKVPIIALMLAEAVNEHSFGKLKDFKLSKAEIYELKIASWLHDCGKLTVPDRIMDKATKLEGIIDGIELIKLRAEIVAKQQQLAREQKKCTAAKFEEFLSTFKADLAFLQQINIGGEFISEENLAKIDAIAAKYSFISMENEVKELLSAKDVENLKIYRGTLNAKERLVMNNHVVMSLEMLNSLRFPENLSNVAEIAGSHHERMDGEGYPRHLAAKDLSIQARILAVADVFEALTAANRPYKQANKLSKALLILGSMAEEGHIDPELFKVFVQNKTYLKYAKQYLEPEQIDEVDETNFPGLKEV